MLVEYADFECERCRYAERAVRELLTEFRDDVCLVFRHLPLVDVHEHAQIAAEAAEAAGAQGRFWAMHDLLFTHSERLELADLMRYADELGLDVGQFADELANHVHAPKVGADIRTADLSGVSGTPTFFINGRRHDGPSDIDTLVELVRTARERSNAS
jgi:protein-disulfide isomerase